MITADNDNQSNDDNKAPTPPIEVPREALSAEALNAVIESFILRDGTDYGSSEVSLESKMSQVMKQIEKGHTRIVFDPDTESVTLMTANQLKTLIR